MTERDAVRSERRDAIAVITVDRPEALAMRGAVAVYIDRDGKYTLFDSTGVSRLTEAHDQMSASA